MLELIVGWLFCTIKHDNNWLFTSNCHFNATFRSSRASSGIQQRKRKKNVATYILVQLHLQHTTFDQWGGRKMSVTQCHAQVTNQMSYTINSSRCLIRECQTGLKEDPESTLYILLVLMYTLSLIFLSFHLFDLSTMCAASQSTLWFVFIQWVALVSVHHLWPLLALFCVH